ncbi:MAG: hypothetical protein IPN94_10320 [Sphingobacteriales bacterium]|nr:hypothetical protein [Sphingobacteriales bacterium]
MIEEILYAWEQDGWKTIRRKLQYWSLRTVEQNKNLPPLFYHNLKTNVQWLTLPIGSVINCEGLEKTNRTNCCF